MSPADQKSAVIVEKLVRPPIKRRSSMDAIVDIGVIAPAEVYDEPFDKPVAPANVKFRREAGADLVQWRRPNARMSYGTTIGSDRFHFGIGARATQGLDENARAIRNWHLLLLAARRLTDTGNALTVRPIAGGIHRNFLVVRRSPVCRWRIAPMAMVKPKRLSHAPGHPWDPTPKDK